jgi:hypothetical protein
MRFAPTRMKTAAFIGAREDPTGHPVPAIRRDGSEFPLHHRHQRAARSPPAFSRSLSPKADIRQEAAAPADFYRSRPSSEAAPTAARL